MINISKEVQYLDNFNLANFKSSSFFLAGDIGGTNSNFGIFSLDSNILLFSVHYKSRIIINFAKVVEHLVSYLKNKYNISISSACFGAAGVVNHKGTFARPTNLSFDIDTEEIKKLTSIKDIFLINDFEAVALGAELLNQEDMVCINLGVSRPHMNKAYLGAGTGLGKCLNTWSPCVDRYLPVPSEGGHSDVVVRTKEELELLNFIRDNNGNCPVSWEDILSGKGIQRIYKFLGTINKYPVTKYTKIIAENEFEPDKISHYAKEDPQSKDTFKWYARFYARCAKNYALDALSLNGFYIAGGIASKNIEVFKDPSFMDEFSLCGKHSYLLRNMSVFIIKNYNVSLYGALTAYRLYRKGYL